jgi:putative tryptophan/tyrosine transport system substrate-binding protein
VIVAAGGTNAVTAAKKATSTIPVVALIGGDPVNLGLAASLSHPGGNITGIAQLVVAAEQKRLELLHELVPIAKTIAYLVNPAGPNAKRQVEDAISQAHALGMKLSVVQGSSEGDFAAAFASVVQDRIGALAIGADPFFLVHRDQLVALSMRHAVPTMYYFREFATAGGLISYGTRLADGYHQLGVYTQGSQGREARRDADHPTIRKNRAYHQSQDGKGAGPRGAAIATHSRGRVDRMSSPPAVGPTLMMHLAAHVAPRH